jgi:hypothetical protein
MFFAMPPIVTTTSSAQSLLHPSSVLRPTGGPQPIWGGANMSKWPDPHGWMSPWQAGSSLRDPRPVAVLDGGVLAAGSLQHPRQRRWCEKEVGWSDLARRVLTRWGKWRSSFWLFANAVTKLTRITHDQKNRSVVQDQIDSLAT